MSNRRPFVALAATALLVCLSALSALAAPPHQTTLPFGTVLSLAGTPHLWIADERGTIHWGGDTRALANRYVNWGDQRQVSLDQLRTTPTGDPWLSAALLKLGDPIYLVKWETNQEKPTLLHIQSIADVRIFGINEANYGAFVLDQVAFEQRYGFKVDTLERGTLASAVPTATPTATPTAGTSAPTATATPAGMTAKLVSRTYDDKGGYPVEYVIHTTIEINGAPPRSRIRVSAVVDEYRCSPTCESGYKSSWGPTDWGDTNADGYFKFEDHHAPYANSTYTFYAVNGQTAKVTLDNDYVIIG